MLNWIINVVAGFFHVSSSELAKLESALPATKKLVDLFNTKKDLITKAQKLEQEVMPVIKQVIQIYNDNQSLIHEIEQFDSEIQPVITEAMVEWKTVGPALALLIDILERNKKKGINPENTITNLKMRLEPKF